MTAAPRLEGQVALVTGASRGIGRAIALALADAGMRVGLLARDAGRLRAVAAECAERRGSGLPVRVDVTEPAAVRAAVAEVTDGLGAVDLLVNGAGIIEPVERALWEVDPDDWCRVVEVNVRGPALFLWAVVPGMLARGRGRVVSLASGMAGRAVPDYSAYSASKGAVMRITDCLAGPLREGGVSIFDVTPGLVRTDVTAAMPMWADHRPDQFFDLRRVCEMVLAVAAGRLDELTGRFLHAGKDEIDGLVAHAAEIRERDGRTLRIRPYGPDDHSL
ncbi:MAG: SDR family oxidoreductase [Streptosporangiales bacterium]|nr:SDR family oxidoreductase [Streptosporangiales bacterium]